MMKKIVGISGALAIAVLGLAAVANGPYYALPSWAQKISCAVGNCPRFIELADWGGAAVLDRETGLVWEKQPNLNFRWELTEQFCNGRVIGNRQGWRMPTLQELASLVDVTMVNPALPIGHPFVGVQSANYWSATTFDNGVGNSAWVVDFGDNTGKFQGAVSAVSKNRDDVFGWCVRGGQGVDPQ